MTSQSKIHPSSEYNSPVPASTPTPSSSKSSSKPSKPSNVFSNDGSFLELFQRSKKEEEEKKKEEDAIARKKNFEARFRKRGKRPPPDEPPTPNAPVVDNQPAKKIKPLTEYEKQVNSYTGSLKDNGIGVRPLVK